MGTVDRLGWAIRVARAAQKHGCRCKVMWRCGDVLMTRPARINDDSNGRVSVGVGDGRHERSEAKKTKTRRE